MRKTYSVGKKENIISIKVSIGTPGIANTKVFQHLEGGQYKLLEESNVDSGNINEVNIGTGEDLIGSYLKIRTVIDYGSIDHSQWEQLGSSIIGNYGVSGGFAGNQSYNFDVDDKTDSSSRQFVIIDMEIDFKK